MGSQLIANAVRSSIHARSRLSKASIVSFAAQETPQALSKRCWTGRGELKFLSVEMLRLPAIPVLLIIYSVVSKHSADPCEEQEVAIAAILELGGDSQDGSSIDVPRRPQSERCHPGTAGRTAGCPLMRKFINLFAI